MFTNADSFFVPKTFRECVLIGGAMVILMLLLEITGTMHHSLGFLIGAPVVVFLHFLGWQALSAAEDASSFLATQPSDDGDESVRVDPWALQKTLMEASDQPIPTTGYQLNKTTLLYMALVLEEASETTAPMLRALQRAKWDEEDQGSLFFVYDWLQTVQVQMHVASRGIRNRLERIDEFYLSMTDDEAVEFADGTTDVTVVNCGLAIAAGVPAQACYLDVAQSNLSKRNSETGKIDKDVSGKWIKGGDYQEPDLMCVLMNHADTWE